MIQELLYTSHQGEGLRKGGGGGFCTVLSTEGMSPQMAQGLEKLSGYKHPFDIHDPRAAQNPINYRHLVTRIGGQTLHVLSRIADSKKEHTGRTNKLAHHLTLSDDDLPLGGPSWVVSTPGFCRTDWDGKVTLVPEVSPTRLPTDDLPIKKCSHWQKTAGDAGWAGHVAQHLLEDRSKPISIIFPLGTPTLELVNEVFSLIPHRQRWQTTFSTYFTSLPAGTTCSLRFLLDGTDEAEILKRDHRQAVVNLAAPLPPLAESPLVQSARTGQINHPKPAPTKPSRGSSRRQRAVGAADELPDLDENDIFDPSLDDDEEYRLGPPTQRERKSAADFRRAKRRPIPEEELPARKTGRKWLPIVAITVAGILMLVMVGGVSALVGGYYYLARDTESTTPEANNTDTPLPEAAGSSPSPQEAKEGYGKPNPPKPSSPMKDEANTAPKNKETEEKAQHTKGEQASTESPGDSKKQEREKGKPDRSQEEPQSESMPANDGKPKSDDDATENQENPEPNKRIFNPLPTTLVLPSFPALFGSLDDDAYSARKQLISDLETSEFQIELYGLDSFNTEETSRLSFDENTLDIMLQFDGEDHQVGTFSLQDKALHFAWNQDTYNTIIRSHNKLGQQVSAIRWCLLSIKRPGEKEHLCALSDPIHVEYSRHKFINRTIQDLVQPEGVASGHQITLPPALTLDVNYAIKPLIHPLRLTLQREGRGYRVSFETRLRKKLDSKAKERVDRIVKIGSVAPDERNLGKHLSLNAKQTFEVIALNPFIKLQEHPDAKDEGWSYPLSSCRYSQNLLFKQLAEELRNAKSEIKFPNGIHTEEQAEVALANIKETKDNAEFLSCAWNYFAWQQYHDIFREERSEDIPNSPFPVSWDGTELRFFGSGFPEGAYVTVLVVDD